jgi:hypothetical protein
MAELNKDVCDFCVTLQGAVGLVAFDYTFRRPQVLDVTGSQALPGRRFPALRVPT